jgi:hypothetical protein
MNCSEHYLSIEYWRDVTTGQLYIRLKKIDCPSKLKHSVGREFQMRLALPDLQHEEQVHQTGIALINLFGADFFKFIDSGLEKSDGVDWLTTYRKSNLVYANYNFIDPSNLLKELLRVSTSPLRKPIRTAIDSKDSVPFFNRLKVILDDRNDWVHHNSKFSREQLKTLILNIYPIAEKLSLLVKAECDFLLSKLDGVVPDIAQVDNPIVPETESKTESKLIKAIQNIIPSDERPIGEGVESEFTEFSYVLHLSGEVRNRKNNELLSELNPDMAESIGALLIARKPNGGRLRLTRDGVIAAYFEDHWGYLATVSPEQWFPDHLHLSV